MEKLDLIKELVKEQLRAQSKDVINAAIEGVDWAVAHSKDKARDVQSEIDRRYPITAEEGGRSYGKALLCTGFEWGVDAYFKYFDTPSNRNSIKLITEGDVVLDGGSKAIWHRSLIGYQYSSYPNIENLPIGSKVKIIIVLDEKGGY